jgi:ubiquinone/menaquinone biosynthesis C-methylase UbiE
MRELESASWWNEAMRNIAGMLLNRARLPDEGRMLDAGCGSGQTMSWFLRSHERWRAAGFDVAMTGIEAAQAEKLAVCRASALELPFESSSIDLILCLDVLQHLPLDGGDSVPSRNSRECWRRMGLCS